jgi:hypothetical protein
VPDYIELRRNFVPVAEGAEPDLAAGVLWGRKYGGWLEWPELLDHARVVLLAEAQSGKTEEFKHAAAGLRERGASRLLRHHRATCGWPPQLEPG